MNIQAIVGIDPGNNGAIASWTERSGIDLLPLKSASERDVAEFLRALGQGVAFIERVSSSPQQGVVSAFSFGTSYGGLRMAIIANRMRLETVSPQKWQSFMQVKKIGGGYGRNDTRKKNATKARAQELFPDIKITHAISDALLIMRFGQMHPQVSLGGFG